MQILILCFSFHVVYINVETDMYQVNWIREMLNLEKKLELEDMV